MQSHLNVGFGSDVTIAQLAQAVAKAVGYPGTIALDPTIPDGPPKKLMNSSRLNTLGWKAAVPLEEGLALAYDNFIKSYSLE
jgi:GDP-L-fucose synthase